MYELNVKVSGESPKNYDELIAALKVQQAAAAAIVEDYNGKTRAVGAAKWEVIKEQLKPLMKAAKDLDTYLTVDCPYDRGLYYVIKDGRLLFSHHCDGDSIGDVIISDTGNYPYIFEQVMLHWSNEIEQFEQCLNEKIKYKIKAMQNDVAYAKNKYDMMTGGNQ